MTAVLGIGGFIVLVIVVVILRGLFVRGVGKAVDKTFDAISGPSEERKKLNDFDK